MEVRDALEIMKSRAVRSIVVKANGSIDEDDLRSIRWLVSTRVYSYAGELLDIGEPLRLVDECIRESGADFTKYWSKDRPITTRWKGIISRMFTKLGFKGSIRPTWLSELLQAIRSYYPDDAVLTMYLCPIRTIQEVHVHSAEEFTCFKRNGCNRRHVDFLETVYNANVYYVGIEFPDGSIGRFILWEGDDVCLAHNLYSRYVGDSIYSLRYAVARMVEILKEYPVRFKMLDGSDIPIYVNNNDLLVIYNVERVANASIGLEKFMEKVGGVCWGCGERRPLYNMFNDDGSIVCGLCSESYICYNCGDRVHEDDVNVVYGNNYCPDCFSELFAYCRNCDQVYYREDMYYYDGELYCEGCFYEEFTHCYECGEAVELERATDVDGYTYCEDCLDKYFVVCSSCDSYVDKRDAVEIDGETFCKECIEDEEGKEAV